MVKTSETNQRAPTKPDRLIHRLSVSVIQLPQVLTCSCFPSAVVTSGQVINGSFCVQTLFIWSIRTPNTEGTLTAGSMADVCVSLNGSWRLPGRCSVASARLRLINERWIHLRRPAADSLCSSKSLQDRETQSRRFTSCFRANLKTCPRFKHPERRTSTTLKLKEYFCYFLYFCFQLDFFSSRVEELKLHSSVHLFSTRTLPNRIRTWICFTVLI